MQIGNKTIVVKIRGVGSLKNDLQLTAIKAWSEMSCYSQAKFSFVNENAPILL